MYFYIKNKKKDLNLFYMKVFFYFHRFIFQNTFGILKKTIYLSDFFFIILELNFFLPQGL